MPTTTLAGSENQVFYIDKGEGRNVLFFVHGLHQNSRDCFGHYIDLLQHTHRVVAIDLPGHGNSYKHEGEEYSHNIAFKACQKIISDISEEADAITVIGHSLGSFLALKLALLDKKKIKNLILISPVVDFTPYENDLKRFVNMPKFVLKMTMFYRAMFDRLPFGDRRQIYDINAGHRIPGRLKHYKIKMKNHPLHAASGYLGSLIGCTLNPLLKNNHMPTLLVYGNNDKLTPAEFASSLASLMPRTILRIIKNAGHNVHLVRKEEVSKLIADFLEDNQRKNSGWRNMFGRNFLRRS